MTEKAVGMSVENDSEMRDRSNASGRVMTSTLSDDQELIRLGKKPILKVYPNNLDRLCHELRDTSAPLA